MITLSSYLNTNHIDGHIHFFSHAGCIFKHMSIPKHYRRIVGFADIEFKHLEEYSDGKMEEYYNDFIKNHYDNTKHVLLATGTTPTDMINIHKKYPGIIKGFGEIKCYDHYQDVELPFGNLGWFKPVLDYNRDFRLPVYIHWYLYNEERVKSFEKLLKEYPEIPFVLCHSGISRKYSNHDETYDWLVGLLEKYNNLFSDISYDAVDYFIKNPNKIIPSRMLIGSDINPNIENYEHDSDPYEEIYNEIQKLDGVVNCDNTFNILFKL